MFILSILARGLADQAQPLRVRELCTRVLWLHKGRQIDFGDDVQGICDRYQQLLDGKLKL